MSETAAGVVAEFEKNSREVVRVSLTEYRGQDLLDVRSFYREDGELKPGKGLAVRRELITPLRKALQAAEKAVKDNVVKEGGRAAEEGQPPADAA